MAGISATVGMRSVTQAALQQLKVQQAKQNAERAEMAARILRAEADAAQSEAERAQENARALYARSDQAEIAAGQARQSLAMIRSNEQMRLRLAGMVGQAAERQMGIRPAPSVPVVNTSGQVTGTVVNTTA